MYQKIFALKNGDHPGIYENWLDFYEQIKEMDYVESKTFLYDSDLIFESAMVVNSLEWAMREARIYLGLEQEECTYLQDEIFDILPEEECEGTEEVNAEEFEQDTELHEFFGIPRMYGNAWVDLILEMCSSNYSNGMSYTDRYYPAKVYFFIMKMVFDVDKLIENYIRPVDAARCKNSSVEHWPSSVKYELDHSKDYNELKNHICSELNMTKLDIEDLERRTVSMVTKRNESLFAANVTTSICLREFLRKGNITLVSLYKELVTNIVYRTDLEKISAIYNNPEIGVVEVEDSKAKSIQQIIREANRLRLELKTKVIGQDAAINKLEKAYFHNVKEADSKKGPKNVFLFAGPPGVGKTYTAELLAKSLEIPYKRFDMSGYGHRESFNELEGISAFWKDSKPGVLTTFVDTHPNCVLLFDEIEKAHSNVIKLFLQIIDEGICFDRFYEKNISFKQCTIILTTNAGRRLYEDAERENLTLMSDRIVIDALEKDVNAETGNPFFPQELISRLSSNTIIMFNHLNSSAIRRVILTNIERYIRNTSKQFNINITDGKYVIAATSQFSIGGSKDARNASKIAGKLISKELYELLALIDEKTNHLEKDVLSNISFECDFTGVDEKIIEYYNGEQNCVIAVFSDRDSFSKLFGPYAVRIKTTSDFAEYQKILKEDKILYAVIDYSLGNRDNRATLNVLDVKSSGSEAFSYAKNNFTDLPVYVLMDDDLPFTEREIIGFREMGVEGIIRTSKMFEEMERCYFDVCCNKAVDSLRVRHQIITYKTRKLYDSKSHEGKIIFYDMKFETAVEAEDRDTILSADCTPNLSWDDIYVSEDIKNELQFFIDYLKNPDEYRKKGVRTPMGALMFGPRGTGKTSLAKVVASESKMSFLATTGAELAGMSSQGIHQIFAKARKYAPCVLFIDEIDAVGYDRRKHGINANLNTLLTEMDGFSTNDKNIVFVMAATNLGKELDPALARRFDRNFLVSLPEKEGRAWMIKRLVNKNKAAFAISDKEIESLATRSDGMSLSDIERVVDLALRDSIRNNKLVDDLTIDEAFELVQYGEARQNISKEDIKITAYHEAGHAVIGLHNGDKPNYISIVSRGGMGGYVYTEGIGNHPTKERYLARICIMLGGRAAELEFGYGITPGASTDLAYATDLARLMVCNYGMYEEEVGLAVIKEEEYQVNEKARALVNRILSEQLLEARRIVNEERNAIERLVDALLCSKKKYLTKADIYSIYMGEN